MHETRNLKYLSPTSMSLFYKDKETFYTTYLALNRPPREPQTQAMSVGSAFDACVKARLASMYLAKDEESEFEALFESQVEPHNRDWAKLAGRYAWQCYLYSGAFNDLCQMLKDRKAEPHMEADVYGEVAGVPLRGKPDLYFTLRTGRFVILDWKVNGFCSKWAKSPDPGYIRVRSGNSHIVSRNEGAPHKSCHLHNIDGVMCNAASLNTFNRQWSTQLVTYAWLVGCPVGAAFIGCIDQLACDNSAGVTDEYLKTTPGVRVAEHRSLLPKLFQDKVLQLYQECYAACVSGHFFTDMSKEDSVAKCQVLDDAWRNYDDSDPVFMELTQDLWQRQKFF